MSESMGRAFDLRGLLEGKIAIITGASPVPTDVTDPDSVERLVSRTVEAHGRLDAAFNNAGEGALQGPLAEVDPSAFGRVIDVNLRGTFLCLRHEIAAMLESGGGSIV